MNSGQLIAIVDDDELTRTWLSEHLAAAGYAVQTAATGKAALRLVQDASPALMLLDLRLPDADGLTLLSRFREIDSEMAVVIVTAYGEFETAVEAVKAGAFQFIQKPPDLDDLLITIEKGLEARRLRQKVAVLQEQHGWQFADVELVGRSGALRELAPFMQGAIERTSPSSRSTALHYPNIWLNQSFSVTRRAPSPTHVNARKGSPNSRTVASCFWMRSATCRPPRRPSCCGS